MKEFKLHYRVQNGGDGSAAVVLHSSAEEATSAEEDENEKYGEGWAESSAGAITLKLEDGRLFYRVFEDVGERFEYSWKEIRE